MYLYPKEYLPSVLQITPTLLENYHIKGIILDVDNTLIDYEKNLLQGVEEWIQSLKQKGYSFHIVSNSHRYEKVKKVAQTLEIPFLHLAKKPFKAGFRKAQETLALPAEQIAVVGDQLMTDVLGANRCQMIPFLVEPIDKKESWITKIKRPLENKIIQQYLKQKEKGIKHVH